MDQDLRARAYERTPCHALLVLRPLDQYGIGTTRMRVPGRCRIALKEGS
jgi:hypothetical protein